MSTRDLRTQVQTARQQIAKGREAIKTSREDLTRAETQTEEGIAQRRQATRQELIKGGLQSRPLRQMKESQRKELIGFRETELKPTRVKFEKEAEEFEARTREIEPSLREAERYVEAEELATRVYDAVSRGSSNAIFTFNPQINKDQDPAMLKLARQIYSDLRNQERASKQKIEFNQQLKEYEKLGLSPVYDKGKIVGFQDKIAQVSYSIDNLGAGLQKFRSTDLGKFEKAGLLTMTGTPTGTGMKDFIARVEGLTTKPGSVAFREQVFKPFQFKQAQARLGSAGIISDKDLPKAPSKFETAISSILPQTLFNVQLYESDIYTDPRVRQFFSPEGTLTQQNLKTVYNAILNPKIKYDIKRKSVEASKDLAIAERLTEQASKFAVDLSAGRITEEQYNKAVGKIIENPVWNRFEEKGYATTVTKIVDKLEDTKWKRSAIGLSDRVSEFATFFIPVLREIKAGEMIISGGRVSLDPTLGKTERVLGGVQAGLGGLIFGRSAVNLFKSLKGVEATAGVTSTATATSSKLATGLRIGGKTALVGGLTTADYIMSRKEGLSPEMSLGRALGTGAVFGAGALYSEVKRAQIQKALKNLEIKNVKTIVYSPKVRQQISNRYGVDIQKDLTLKLGRDKISQARIYITETTLKNGQKSFAVFVETGKAVKPLAGKTFTETRKAVGYYYDETGKLKRSYTVDIKGESDKKITRLISNVVETEWKDKVQRSLSPLQLEKKIRVPATQKEKSFLELSRSKSTKGVLIKEVRTQSLVQKVKDRLLTFKERSSLLRGLKKSPSLILKKGLQAGKPIETSRTLTNIKLKTITKPMGEKPFLRKGDRALVYEPGRRVETIGREISLSRPGRTITKTILDRPTVRMKSVKWTDATGKKVPTLIEKPVSLKDIKRFEIKVLKALTKKGVLDKETFRFIKKDIKNFKGFNVKKLEPTTKSGGRLIQVEPPKIETPRVRTVFKQSEFQGQGLYEKTETQPAVGTFQQLAVEGTKSDIAFAVKKLGTAPRFDVGLASGQTSLIQTIQKPSQRQSFKVDTKQIQEPTLGSKSILTPAIKSIQQPARLQITTPQLRQLPRQREDTRTRIRTGQRREFKREPIRKPEVSVRFKSSDSSFGKMIETKAKSSFLQRSRPSAFRVEIKRKGEFVTASKPLTKVQAERFGKRLALRGLEATVRLRPTEERARRIRVRPLTREEESAFRDYRIVKGKKVPLADKWIQKREARLTTSFERKAIQEARRKKLR